ncbi:hypothetical protein Pelo_7573 [Pelomyxa schiedti]|nr:hypothetical protein Pelo_7573 [Pelomyxa schiedti]
MNKEEPPLPRQQQQPQPAPPQPQRVAVRGTLAAPHHVLWARDQLAALLACVVVPRCGARGCPASLVPHAVLACDIGQRLVMHVDRQLLISGRHLVASSSSAAPAAAAAANTHAETNVVVVGVSLTLGVVGLRGWCGITHIEGVFEWVGVGCGLPIGARSNIEVVDPVEMTAVEEVVSGNIPRGYLDVRKGRNWAVLCKLFDYSAHTILIRPLGLLLHGGGGVTKGVYVTGEIQLVDMINDNEAALLIRIEDSHRRFHMLCVDLEKSYDSGQLVVTDSVPAFGTIKGMVFHSKDHKLIVPMNERKKSDPGTPVVGLRSLRPLKVLHTCSNWVIHKVDSTHFAEEDITNNTLSVFSTDEFERPVRIFTLDGEFKCGNGFIALMMQQEGCFDLVDAVTGTWLRLPGSVYLDALGQFVALGAGVIVGRCGAASDVSSLTPPLLSLIGRDWVMQPNRRILFSVGRDTSAGPGDPIIPASDNDQAGRGELGQATSIVVSVWVTHTLGVVSHRAVALMCECEALGVAAGMFLVVHGPIISDCCEFCGNGIETHNSDYDGEDGNVVLVDIDSGQESSGLFRWPIMGAWVGPNDKVLYRSNWLIVLKVRSMLLWKLDIPSLELSIKSAKTASNNKMATSDNNNNNMVTFQLDINSDAAAMVDDNTLAILQFQTELLLVDLAASHASKFMCFVECECNLQHSAPGSHPSMWSWEGKVFVCVNGYGDARSTEAIQVWPQHHGDPGESYYKLKNSSRNLTVVRVGSFEVTLVDPITHTNILTVSAPHFFPVRHLHLLCD